jgi:LPXTG-site transpeptidase (sortase) family protein
MRRLNFHRIIIALGLVVTFSGLASAFSNASAISYLIPDNSDQVGNDLTNEWSEDGVDKLWYDSSDYTLDQLSKDFDLETLPVPSGSFLTYSEIDDTSNVEGNTNDHLLAEIYESEMLYPLDVANQVITLPTPVAPEIPLRLIIPAIKLNAPILPAEAEDVTIDDKNYQVWRAPDEYAVGWHATSASLGIAGNTVLNGHHNIEGQVFKHLVDLKPGDVIFVESENAIHRYVILNRMILPEKYAPLEDRIENARWIQPSEDERLTLITCWPYESNTHRLILVARSDH